jgi:hypothetical protein
LTKKGITIKRVNEKKVVIFLLSAVLLIFISLDISSEAGFSDDDYSHYLFSKAAPWHPELYLHLWARPGFTLASSPFAQFGFIGFQIFNSLTAVITCYITYLVAKDYKLKRPSLVIILTSFSVYFFILSVSGLTEMFASFLLILGVYLIGRKRFLASALCISFLGISRPEGILFILIWVVLLLRKKRIPECLALFAFPLALIIAGSFQYNNILWFIESNVNADVSNLAKNYFTVSRFFQYSSAMILILGVIPFQLFIIGFLRTLKKLSYTHIVFLLYLFAQSYVFSASILWAGFNLRYFVIVTPIAAIFMLNGLNAILKKNRHALIISILLLIQLLFIHLTKDIFIALPSYYAILGLIIPVGLLVIKFISFRAKKFGIFLFFILTGTIISPFLYADIPFQQDSEERMIMHAARYIKDNNYQNERNIYYYHPYVGVGLGVRISDWNIHHWPANIKLKDMPDKSIFIFTPKYAPKHGKTGTEILNDNGFKFIKGFSMQGTEFKVSIYEKHETGPD